MVVMNFSTLFTYSRCKFTTSTMVAMAVAVMVSAPAATAASWLFGRCPLLFFEETSKSKQMAFENFHKQCAKPRPHYVWLRDKKAPFLRAQPPCQRLQHHRHHTPAHVKKLKIAYNLRVTRLNRRRWKSDLGSTHSDCCCSWGTYQLGSHGCGHSFLCLINSPLFTPKMLWQKKK